MERRKARQGEKEAKGRNVLDGAQKQKNDEDTGSKIDSPTEKERSEI